MVRQSIVYYEGFAHSSIQKSLVLNTFKAVEGHKIFWPSQNTWTLLFAVYYSVDSPLLVKTNENRNANSEIDLPHCVLCCREGMRIFCNYLSDFLCTLSNKRVVLLIFFQDFVTLIANSQGIIFLPPPPPSSQYWCSNKISSPSSFIPSSQVY